LSVSVSDPDSEDADKLSVIWKVEGEEKGSGESFVFNANGVAGEHTITAEVSDGVLSNSTTFKVFASEVPLLTGFDGATSKLSAGNLASVPNFTLEKTGKGKVIFGEGVDLSDVIDFVNNVLMNDSFVSIDSSSLSGLANRPAHVVFYNVNVADNPIIYYDGGFGVAKENVKSVCPTSICANITYSGSTVEFDVAHFSTFVLRGSSSKLIDFESTNKIVIEISRGTSSINEGFVIKNNGLAILDLTISSSFDSGYDLSISSSSVSLLPGSFSTIDIKGDIVPSSNTREFKIGTVTLKGNGVSNDVGIYLKEKNMIEIEEVDLSVGEIVYGNVEDGESISISPGEDVELDIDIKNLFSESEGIEMENVRISVKIKDIDMGRDILEKTRSFDIRAGKTERESITFTLPDKFDKNRYDLEIKLVGKDETNDVEYRIKWNLKLKVGSGRTVISTGNSILVDPEPESYESPSEIILNSKKSEKKKDSDFDWFPIIGLSFIVLIIILFILIVAVSKGRRMRRRRSSFHNSQRFIRPK